MSLTAADVEEIMRLVEQSGFDELELEMGGTKLTLRRDTGDKPPRHITPVSTDAPLEKLPAAAAAPVTAAAAPARVLDPNIHEVVAPLLGTFYHSPKPGSAPFVQVGTEVEEDTIVGIIEVMKLMNSVRANVRGTVTEILVADGTLAEYGEPLVRIRKSG
jgi:acetyl-CoA carboxylase biotin carboxyl carrier protein